MKKLMLGAAAAAMTGAAFAAAQVYDIQAVAVTTTAAWGTIQANSNPLRPAAGEILYRVPATTYFGGAIWGCNCDAISGNYVATTNDNGRIRYDGMVLWNQAGKPVYLPNPSTNEYSYSYRNDNRMGLGWYLLNCIGAWGELAEGVFCINDRSYHSRVSQYDNCGGYYHTLLVGAGFGTAINSTVKDENGCDASVIGYLTGNFAGMLPAPQSTENGEVVCYYCGDEVIPSSCEIADAWEFCPCLDDSDVGYETYSYYQTAIYGQFAIVYNAAYSALLQNAADITLVYPFPTAVKAAVEELHTPLIAVE